MSKLPEDVESIKRELEEIQMDETWSLRTMRSKRVELLRS